MSIYQGSRYEYSVVDFVAIEAEGNENPIVFYDVQDPGTFSYENYTCVAGDRLDIISYNAYGRADLWWYILDKNPQIFDGWYLKAGTILRIPRG
jgi:hypothetical protein